MDFVRDRPEKVSITQVTDTKAEYPKITVCSPAFFNKSKYVLFWSMFFTFTTAYGAIAPQSLGCASHRLLKVFL